MDVGFKIHLFNAQCDSKLYVDVQSTVAVTEWTRHAAVTAARRAPATSAQ